MRKPTPIEQCIANYAHRFWKRSGLTKWPCVRRVARALRLRQQVIEDHMDWDYYQLTSFNCPDEKLGDHYVEAFTKDVDNTWEAYLNARWL